jgi:hypothetical protein
LEQELEFEDRPVQDGYDRELGGAVYPFGIGVEKERLVQIGTCEQSQRLLDERESGSTS